MRISKGLSVLLDCFRWTAALEVTVFHLRRFMFIPRANANLAWKIFFLLTSYGHEAVIVFFVLSGFLVGGSVIDEMAAQKFNWRVYMAKRIARIYPVFLLGLAVGFSLDYTGLHNFDKSGLYSTAHPLRIGSINESVSSSLHAPVVVGNCLMLQTIFVPTLGSNGPLWSLSYEFWYYVLFPAAALALGGVYLSRNARLACGVLAAVICAFVGDGILLYFVVWLSGVAAFVAPPPSSARLRRLLPWFACALILILLIFSKLMAIFVFGGIVADAPLGVGMALLVYSLKGVERINIGSPRVHRFLADFSYSQYIFHFPLCFFALAVVYQFYGTGFFGEPTVGRLWLFFALILFSMAFAYAVSLITERRTAQFRDLLLRVSSFGAGISWHRGARAFLPAEGAAEK
jgi:peptidoglycan/LPS O-acetylase OafA/YrhL